LKTNRDFAATEWLRKEIFNEKKVSARKWLLGKTEELISSH
jgi:hypothetical protein